MATTVATPQPGGSHAAAAPGAAAVAPARATSRGAGGWTQRQRGRRLMWSAGSPAGVAASTLSLRRSVSGAPAACLPRLLPLLGMRVGRWKPAPPEWAPAMGSSSGNPQGCASTARSPLLLRSGRLPGAGMWHGWMRRCARSSGWACLKLWSRKVCCAVGAPDGALAGRAQLRRACAGGPPGQGRAGRASAAAGLPAPITRLYAATPPAAPDHITNEYVELAKRVQHKGAGGVANFVLRCAIEPLARWAHASPPHRAPPCCALLRPAAPCCAALRRPRVPSAAAAHACSCPPPPALQRGGAAARGWPAAAAAAARQGHGAGAAGGCAGGRCLPSHMARGRLAAAVRR